MFYVRICILLYLLFNIAISSQADTMFICGTEDDGTNKICAHGGEHITSIGNVKALVIFIQFSDDTDSLSTSWPLDTFPVWAQNFLNENPGNNFPNANLSEYFYDMSNGKFELTGTVYHSLVYPDSPQTYYNNLGEVNYEILTHLDPEIVYSDFDNWDGVNPGPDGEVDMIYLIYRNFENRLIGGLNYTAKSALDLTSDITADGVVIRRGWPHSGIQQRGGRHGATYTKYVSAHEFGHRLFGTGHIHGIPNLGIMSGRPVWNDGRGMICWERERLNWITYEDVTSDQTVYVSDYYTIDTVVYRIPVTTNEYFLIDNRQNIDMHDWAGDKGVYIYHVKSGNYFPPSINVECADGNWDFDFNTTTLYITKTNPNPNGKDELDTWFYYDSNGDEKNELYACYPPYYYKWAAWGDDEDAFSMDFNRIFSPWSNPRSTNNGALNFSVELLGEDNGVYELDINFSDPATHSPSKPINFHGTLQNTYPNLSWELYSEPDFNHYEIWKKNTPTGNWFIYTTTTSNSFTDENNQYAEVVYKIRAVDDDNNYSVFTYERSLNPGTISSNTNWSGSFTVRLNITVENGATLTIAPGSNINYKTNKWLTIYGTLNAQGSYTNRITFDRSGSSGTWGGIYFSGSASSELEYCDIKNAMTGIELDNCSVDIFHTHFRYCPIAIDLEGLSYTSLYGCELTGSEVIGVYSDVGSSTEAEYTLFSNTPFNEYSYGIMTMGDFSALYCQISEAGTGLFIDEDSWVDLGDESTEETGFNNILNNTDYDIETYEDILA